MHQKRPANADPLPLSTRQAETARAHLCGVSLGKRLDECVGVGELCHFDDFLKARVWPTVGDVLRHGSIDQLYVLTGDPDAASPGSGVDFPQINSVHRDQTGRWLEKPTE